VWAVDQLGVTAHLGDRFIERCKSFGRLQCDEIVAADREHDRFAFDGAGAAETDYDRGYRKSSVSHTLPCVAVKSTPSLSRSPAACAGSVAGN
jgi:hypothetical protein